MLASLFFTIYISWDSSRFLKWLSIKWAAVCWWINSESTHQTPSQLSTCPGGWIHSLLPQRTMAMDQNVKASPLHGQVIFRQFCGHFHHAYFSQPDILTHPHDKCPRSTLHSLDENVTITHRWRTAEDFVPLHWAVWWHPHTRPSVQDAQFFLWVGWQNLKQNRRNHPIPGITGCYRLVLSRTRLGIAKNGRSWETVVQKKLLKSRTKGHWNCSRKLWVI